MFQYALTDKGRYAICWISNETIAGTVDASTARSDRTSRAC